MENPSEILGKTGTDALTGFMGTVVSICHHLDGTTQYLLQPTFGGEDYTYKLPSAKWFDSERVSVTL